jgi:lipoprotein-anchoring transpeptidase ErfK/SrfK
LCCLAAASLVLAACSSARSVKGSGSLATGSGGSSSPTGSTPARPSTSAKPKPAGKPVHISLKFSDGSVFGIGIPVIAFFSRQFSDASALQKATTATVNGQPLDGRWYFEKRYQDPGHPVEGDFRPANYWPAHASILVKINAKGQPAGGGNYFDDSLSLSFATGPANIGVVNDSTHRLTITSDNTPWGSFPVSLGATDTPTRRGVKVVMEKGLSVCMSGPGYSECGVKFTQRLTYDGEYLHAAPWNVAHIQTGVDSSNGCTNLLPADAQKLYDFLRIGDVVQYPDANGPKMGLGDGYGDWNVSWSAWQTGGLIPTNS